MTREEMMIRFAAAALAGFASRDRLPNWTNETVANHCWGLAVAMYDAAPIKDKDKWPNEVPHRGRG